MSNNQTSNKKRKFIIVGAVGLLVIAYLAFAVFGVQTLFVDNEVDEAGPVFSSQAADTPDADTPDADSTVTTEALAMDEEESSPTTALTAEITVLAEGSFIDRAHPSTGLASVLGDGSEQRFLRFEEFETDNGPDLFVYLTTANSEADEGEFGKVGEFIDLGSLKGNVGDQNYEIPADIDIEVFNTVVIWCKRFGVAFGAADLS